MEDEFKTDMYGGLYVFPSICMAELESKDRLCVHVEKIANLFSSSGIDGRVLLDFIAAHGDITEIKYKGGRYLSTDGGVVSINLEHMLDLWRMGSVSGLREESLGSFINFNKHINCAASWMIASSYGNTLVLNRSNPIELKYAFNDAVEKGFGKLVRLYRHEFEYYLGKYQEKMTNQGKIGKMNIVGRGTLRNELFGGTLRGFYGLFGYLNRFSCSCGIKKREWEEYLSRAEDLFKTQDIARMLSRPLMLYDPKKDMRVSARRSYRIIAEYFASVLGEKDYFEWYYPSMRASLSLANVDATRLLRAYENFWRRTDDMLSYLLMVVKDLAYKKASFASMLNAVPNMYSYNFYNFNGSTTTSTGWM